MEIASFIFSLCAFGFSLYAFIDLMAQKKSTHQIQLIDPQDHYFKSKGIVNQPNVTDDYVEFDMPSEMDLATEEMKKKPIN